MKRIFLTLCLSFSTQAISPSVRAEDIPSQLQEIGVTEHIGEKIDLSLMFKNDMGQSVPLSTYFHSKPVMFFLVYYECPSLCTLVLREALEVLKKISMTAGQDFEIVAVSIDPREKSEMAKLKQESFLKEYGRGKGWNFLVGDQPQIDAIASQIGFRFRWDEETQQFAHSSNFFVLTPQGILSRYFYGLNYAPQDVRLALTEAGQGKTGSFIDKILLFCYHYDANNKRYVLMATRIMTFGTSLTLVLLILLMFRFRKTEHNTGIVHN